MVTLRDGSFLAVWSSVSDPYQPGAPDDPDGYAVRAQIFNRDGTKRGGEFLVNATTANDQRHPSVAVLADGRFVVAWQDTSQTDVPPGGDVTSSIRARIFQADGAPADPDGRGTGDFLVSRDLSSQLDHPSVAALSNGGFTVSYNAFREGASSPSRTKAQSFDAAGRYLGDEKTIDALRNGDMTPPLTLGLGGHYAVVYSKDGSGYAMEASHIYGTIRAASGSTVKAEFRISTGGAANVEPEGAVLRDGRFVVVWASGAVDGAAFDLKAQVFNPDGSRAGAELTLAQGVAAAKAREGVTATADGGFALAYLTLKDENQADLHVRAFTADGQPAGGDLVIGQTHLAWPYDDDVPALTGLADGRFVTMWEHRLPYTDPYGPNGWTTDVFGQIVDPAAIPATPPPVVPFPPATPVMPTPLLPTPASPGNDVWFAGLAAEAFDGLAGLDTVSYALAPAGVTAHLAAPFRNTGAAAGDTYRSIENLAGSAFADRLTGDAGANALNGGAGNDAVSGGSGRDILTGGPGRDTFVFEARVAKVKNANVDRITDFNVRDDAVQLENGVFKSLGKGSLKKPGLLQKGFFTLGPKAQDADDHVIYHRKTGALFYDPDGTGPQAQIKIALLAKSLKMTNKDFFVI